MPSPRRLRSTILSAACAAAIAGCAAPAPEAELRDSEHLEALLPADDTFPDNARVEGVAPHAIEELLADTAFSNVEPQECADTLAEDLPLRPPEGTTEIAARMATMEPSRMLEFSPRTRHVLVLASGDFPSPTYDPQAIRRLLQSCSEFSGELDDSPVSARGKHLHLDALVPGKGSGFLVAIPGESAMSDLGRQELRVAWGQVHDIHLLVTSLTTVPDTAPPLPEEETAECADTDNPEFCRKIVQRRIIRQAAETRATEFEELVAAVVERLEEQT